MREVTSFIDSWCCFLVAGNAVDVDEICPLVRGCASLSYLLGNFVCHYTVSCDLGTGTGLVYLGFFIFILENLPHQSFP